MRPFVFVPTLGRIVYGIKPRGLNELALLFVSNFFKMFLTILGRFNRFLGIFVSTDHCGPKQNRCGDVGTGNTTFFARLGFKFLRF